jgi:acyl-CoA thioester hydrolase
MRCEDQKDDSMSERFAVNIGVRAYELDHLGHLNGSVYVQYADHARWECVNAAGVSVEVLQAAGVAPVNLETTLRFHRELRAGDQVEVSCVFEWGDGKTFRVIQEIRRADDTLAAEVSSVCGVMDLTARKLVRDPAERWRALATAPELLGL